MDPVTQRMRIVDLVIGINSMIFDTDVLESRRKQQYEETYSKDKSDFLAYRISVNRIRMIGALLGYAQKHKPVLDPGSCFIKLCRSVLEGDMQREPRMRCKRYRDGMRWFHIRHPVHLIACQLYPRTLHKLRRYRNLRQSCNRIFQLLLSGNKKKMCTCTRNKRDGFGTQKNY